MNIEDDTPARELLAYIVASLTSAAKDCDGDPDICVWHVLADLVEFSTRHNVDLDSNLADARDFFRANHDGPRRT